MWSQLAWFDEEFQANDPEVREWVRARPQFHAGRPAPHGRKAARDRGPGAARVPASWRPAGQIEISTTPYYHPILPLLCDSNIASVVAPRRAAAAALPLSRGRPPPARAGARFIAPGTSASAPAGLWPSEGSVSDEAFAIAAELGFQWAATDSGVLNRTLGRGVAVDGLYRPYRWQQGGQSLGVIFRDHLPERPDRLRLLENGRGARPPTISCTAFATTAAGILGAGRDALVPIILDGENAWEYYDHNGRPFLRELYRRISDDRAHERRHRERRPERCWRRSRSTTSSPAPGSTPISTSGSAPKRTTRPGPSCCAPARPSIPPPASPKTGAAWPSKSC